MSFNLLLHILQSDKSYQPNFLEIPWNQKYCQKLHDDRYLEKYGWLQYTKCEKNIPKYINDIKQWFTDYLSILPIVRICNCQWNICQYTKCHTIKCHTQRIVIYLKLWLIISFFILLNDIQEKITIHKGHRDHKCNSCEK